MLLHVPEFYIVLENEEEETKIPEQEEEEQSWMTGIDIIFVTLVNLVDANEQSHELEKKIANYFFDLTSDCGGGGGHNVEKGFKLEFKKNVLLLCRNLIKKRYIVILISIIVIAL